MPIVKAQDSKKSFDPIPAGVHQAVCVSIVDVGTHVPANPQHRPSRKVWLTWELPHETITIDGEAKPRQISEKYTLSLHEKGRLLPMLQSWRGAKFTADELKGFDMSKLIGRNCQLNVTHASSKDGTKTYANVSAVIPLPKGMPPIAPSGKTLVYDLPEAGAITVPEAVPEWLAKQIKDSVEYKERMGNSPIIVKDDEPAADDDKPF